jgi:hypothetical protein
MAHVRPTPEVTMSRLIRACLLVAGLLALPSAAQAQSFGVRLGYYTDASDPFIGAEFITKLAPDLYLNPNVEAVLVDGGRYFTFNSDVHYDLPNSGRTFVWLGAGLAVASVDPEGPGEGDTDLGLNLLAGLGTRRGRVVPYVQAKVIVKDSSEFVIGVGVRF